MGFVREDRRDEFLGLVRATVRRGSRISSCGFF
jgi:hypothetical protein